MTTCVTAIKTTQDNIVMRFLMIVLVLLAIYFLVSTVKMAIQHINAYVMTDFQVIFVGKRQCRVIDNFVA